MRPVFFQHLRKTAGTSLADTLKLFFRSEAVASPAEALFSQSLPISHALAMLRRFELVISHSEILSSAPAAALKFTVFREPFSRLLSERRQWMQARSENLAVAPSAVRAATLALQHRTLADILHQLFEYPVLAVGFWNHQALTLGAWPILREESLIRRSSAFAIGGFHEHFSCGGELRRWLTTNKGRISKRARAALSNLDYVGLAEDFDTSIREIFARIGLPEPGVAIVRNARLSFEDEIDPDLLGAAKEFLEVDFELYELAKERHAVFGRIDRGSPIDYIKRPLCNTLPCVLSSAAPPGGHGWYPAHRRGDGAWGRWSGPGVSSRYSLAATPGTYRLDVTFFGASTADVLADLAVTIEGQPLTSVIEQSPDGLWTFCCFFSRSTCDRFDLVFIRPSNGSEFGFELKELKLSQIEPQTLGERLEHTIESTTFARLVEMQQDFLLFLSGSPAHHELAEAFANFSMTFADLLRLPRARGVEGTPSATVDSIFMGFAEVVQSLLGFFAMNNIETLQLEEEVIEHGRYALSRLGGVVVPSLFQPMARTSPAFVRGTPEFDRMLVEAVANMIAILCRAAKMLTNSDTRYG